MLRYGSSSEDCFFLIRGKVEKLVPVKTSFTAKYEEDLIKYYADNYDNIIWEKVDDCEEVKHFVDMYRSDPD